MSSPVRHKSSRVDTAALFNVTKSSDLLWYFIYSLWIFYKLPTHGMVIKFPNFYMKLLLKANMR